jgi:hypothetical protein
MSTLDDKLLGEKLHYYCSSSEDEDEPALQRVDPSQEQPQPRPQPVLDGSSGNTGPKGVIKDWQRFKQLETEKREDAHLEKIALGKKLQMSCKTAREEDEEKEREKRIEEELQELMNDDFMQEYMQKRMHEMMSLNNKNTKKFGELIHLRSGEDFLTAVDSEEKTCTVIVLLHEPEVEGCETMLGCLRCLAKDHKPVKFCEIFGSAAGLSKHFKVSGVPALLVYRDGQLISSFVRLTDQLGENFYANDVESFLQEHSLLPNLEEVPRIIRGPNLVQDEDED